jgi:hypothetical protein
VDSASSVEDLTGVLAAPVEPPIQSRTMPWVQTAVRAGVEESRAEAWDSRVAELTDELYRASAEAGVPPPALPDQRAADRERLVAADQSLATMVTDILRVERWLKKVERQRSVLAVTPVPVSRWARAAVLVIAAGVGAAAAFAVANLMAETTDLLFGRPWFRDMEAFLPQVPEEASYYWALQFAYCAAAVQVAGPFLVLVVQTFSKVGWRAKLAMYACEAAFALGFLWMRRSTDLAELATPAGFLELAIAGFYALVCAIAGDAMSQQHHLAVGLRAQAQLLGAQAAALQERTAALVASCQAAVKAVASVRLGEEAQEHIRRRVALASTTAQLAYYEAVSAQAAAAEEIPLQTYRGEGNKQTVQA